MMVVPLDKVLYIYVSCFSEEYKWVQTLADEVNIQQTGSLIMGVTSYHQNQKYVPAIWMLDQRMYWKHWNSLLHIVNTWSMPSQSRHTKNTNMFSLLTSVSQLLSNWIKMQTTTWKIYSSFLHYLLFWLQGFPLKGSVPLWHSKTVSSQNFAVNLDMPRNHLTPVRETLEK